MIETNEKKNCFSMQFLDKKGRECYLIYVLGKEGETGWGRLLLRWVVCEADAFCDVTLQAFYASFEEGLFVLVEVGEWVVGLLCSGSLVIISNHC
jgi:hypothetical protein